MSKRICLTCLHWDAGYSAAPIDEPLRGFCRANAPTTMTTSSRFEKVKIAQNKEVTVISRGNDALWPMTNESDYCGQWKEDTEEE